MDRGEEAECKGGQRRMLGCITEAEETACKPQLGGPSLEGRTLTSGAAAASGLRRALVPSGPDHASPNVHEAYICPGPTE
jgi:hypothetical protein